MSSAETSQVANGHSGPILTRHASAFLWPQRPGWLTRDEPRGLI